MVHHDPSSSDDEFPLLKANGLYASDISGDGDCLFHALSDQVGTVHYPLLSLLDHLSVSPLSYTNVVMQLRTYNIALWP